MLHCSGKSSTCGRCARVFSSHSNRLRHEKHCTLPPCTFCGASFDSDFARQRHLQSCVPRLKCRHTRCESTFSTTFNRKRHEEACHVAGSPTPVSEAVRFQCRRQGCTSSFTTAFNRTRHENTCRDPVPRSPPSPLQCRRSGCTFQFTTSANRARHEAACRGVVPACTKCGYRAQTWGNHDRHISHCRGRVSREWPCRKGCGTVFTTEPALSRHELRCGVTFPCRKGCSRLFLTPSRRALHEHTCTPRASSTSQSLAELTCSRCGLTFSSVRSLQRHMGVCGVAVLCRKGCGAEFRTARQRGVHERDCTYRKRTIFCSLCVRTAFWTMAEYDAHVATGVHDMPVPSNGPLLPGTRFFHPSSSDWALIAKRKLERQDAGGT